MLGRGVLPKTSRRPKSVCVDSEERGPRSRLLGAVDDECEEEKEEDDEVVRWRRGKVRGWWMTGLDLCFCERWEMQRRVR